MKGTVVKSTGSWYEVKSESGETIKCRLKGIFRLDEDKEKDSNPVAVGDKVVIEKGDGGDTWVIGFIEPRENYIVRTSPKHKGARQIIAANLDQLLLVVTMASPRTSTGFMDRFLMTAEAYHIPTILIFNKQDMLNAKSQKKQDYVREIYEHIGYHTLFISALNGDHIEEVKEVMKNKTSLLAGHSGTGKSTLLNAIDPGLRLRTEKVSKTTGKGMHTTTFAEMYDTGFGARIIDTPGIREFGILDFKPEEISHYFIEMREVLNHCKFNNCTHENEPGCAVRKAYEEGRISEERYVNYLTILHDYKANYKHWEQ
jgi:ribosome biogenesis GTPase / thiamine phosphate phosphatase